MSLRKPTRRSSPVHVEPVRPGGTPARTPSSVEMVKARWQHGTEVRQSKAPGLAVAKDRKKPRTDLPL